MKQSTIPAKTDLRMIDAPFRYAVRAAQLDQDGNTTVKGHLAGRAWSAMSLFTGTTAMVACATLSIFGRLGELVVGRSGKDSFSSRQWSYASCSASVAFRSLKGMIDPFSLPPSEHAVIARMLQDKNYAPPLKLCSRIEVFDVEELEALGIDRAQITDEVLERITARCRRLKRVNLNETPITDLKPLVDSQQLRELNIAATTVKDHPAPEKCPLLRKIVRVKKRKKNNSAVGMVSIAAFEVLFTYALYCVGRGVYNKATKRQEEN